MNYLNGEVVKLRDAVVGRDMAGRPVGGHVIETRPNGEILIGPAVQSSVLANPEECVPLDALFEANIGKRVTGPATSEGKARGPVEPTAG